MSLKCYTLSAALIGLAVTTGAYAQPFGIHSAFYFPREFHDIPGAVLTTVSNYSTLISFNEAGVSTTNPPPNFANHDSWYFSNNGGTSAYGFQQNNYFHASFDLTLTGTPITPRKEAGFMFHTGTDGDIQFIVNTDGHEVVQFGGVSFWSFSGQGQVPPYQSGTKITLAMSYFLDGNGKNAVQFGANGAVSPVFEFGPGIGGGATGIDNGSTLGGYFQIVNDAANPSNGGSAVFQNITIVPEPSVCALLGLGVLPLLFRRRR